MRENGEHRQQVANEMTAGIAKERTGVWEIVGQKAEQGAEGQEGDESHQVLAVRRGNNGEMIGPNRSQASAEAVHVVHEVEGVDDGENPQDGDGVTEDEAGNKERNPRASCGDKCGNEELTGELRARAQFTLIVQPTNPKHAQSTEKYAGQFHGAAT